MTCSDKYLRKKAARLISSIRSGEPLNKYDENALVAILIRFAENKQPILCKDCKNCYEEGFVNVRNVCEKHPEIENPADDWFCADGERKPTQTNAKNNALDVR
jgi:hypothetical protein